MNAEIIDALLSAFPLIGQAERRSGATRARRKVPPHRSIPLRRQAQAGPARVLGRQHVAFGVGHKAQDAAAGVADAGHVALRDE